MERQHITFRSIKKYAKVVGRRWPWLAPSRYLYAITGERRATGIELVISC
jgi:hypothetical protein